MCHSPGSVMLPRSRITTRIHFLFLLHYIPLLCSLSSGSLWPSPLEHVRFSALRYVTCSSATFNNRTKKKSSWHDVTHRRLSVWHTGIQLTSDLRPCSATWLQRVGRMFGSVTIYFPTTVRWGDRFTVISPHFCSHMHSLTLPETSEKMNHSELWRRDGVCVFSLCNWVTGIICPVWNLFI